MEIPYSAETDVGGNALHAILSVIRENSRRTARPRCSADHPSRLRAKIPMENGTLPLIIFGKTAKTASPPVFAGDSPSLGYAGLRCPGRSRDPFIRRSCCREMDPGFRQGSVQYYPSSGTRSAFPHHRVAQRADAGDLDLDHVAVL